MSMLSRLLAVAAVLPLAAAQCPFSSLSVQSAGASCNLQPTGCCAIVSGPTQLNATLAVTPCALEMQVPAVEGCCGVVVPARILVLGDVLTAVPFPNFGPTCTLWVLPGVALVLTLGDSFSLAIPPALPPITFLAQAAAIHTSPFGPPVVTFSEAKALSLR
jgi:hypothetical protein